MIIEKNDNNVEEDRDIKKIGTLLNRMGRTKGRFSPLHSIVVFGNYFRKKNPQQLCHFVNQSDTC